MERRDVALAVVARPELVDDGLLGEEAGDDHLVTLDGDAADLDLPHLGLDDARGIVGRAGGLHRLADELGGPARERPVGPADRRHPDARLPGAGEAEGAEVAPRV